ncbi:MAG: hypothetical protein PHY05_07115 [Methanothrix sp.]|nr:hypothetical protein [Methanothrix sp.]
MIAHWSLRKCIQIVILFIMVDFLTIAAISQDYDIQPAPGGKSDGFQVANQLYGYNCLIACLDRNDIKSGPRYLNGVPSTGEVELLDHERLWRMIRFSRDPDIYRIQCLVGEGNRWLASSASSGDVWLSKAEDIPETKWQLIRISDDPVIYRIKTYNTDNKGRNRWLWGSIDTANVRCGLNANYQNSNYNIYNSDTSWRIIRT